MLYSEVIKWISGCPGSVNIAVRAFRGRLSLRNSIRAISGKKESEKTTNNKCLTTDLL